MIKPKRKTKVFSESEDNSIKKSWIGWKMMKENHWSSMHEMPHTHHVLWYYTISERGRWLKGRHRSKSRVARVFYRCPFVGDSPFHPILTPFPTFSRFTSFLGYHVTSLWRCLRKVYAQQIYIYIYISNVSLAVLSLRGGLTPSTFTPNLFGRSMFWTRTISDPAKLPRTLTVILYSGTTSQL